ncbi:MAG: NADH-quinone oxidoreductase subunit D [Bdellovibrionales bacterium]|nr:NADH-quinone oxidoreductase subunit D [Bdellovibrionales bacterium]
MSTHGESLATDLAYWGIGPYHQALPGPFRLNLNLDGEVIAETKTEIGFIHRSLEKTFELHPWSSALMYADRLDPEAASFGEMAVALAIEEVAEIAVPVRAQSIRVLVNELNRVSCHLGFLARMAQAVGAETLFHYALRDRERILDQFELLTGARFSLNFFRLGGVTADVTDGFLERVLDICEVLKIRLKEYNDLFSFNYAFLKRSRGIGVISREQILAHGLTGPNARASGFSTDTRKSEPYSGYQLLDFPVLVENDGNGDVHSRFLIRLREISQSTDILKQVIESIPGGSFLSQPVSKPVKPQPGEAYIKVESPRGTLGCHLVSEGGDRPSRVQFRVPSMAAIAILPEILRGSRMEDLPVILASLDLGIAEVDR